MDEEEEFPFNLSDFVTVDEVGDVTDLPRSPSPVTPMETTEVQQDTSEVHFSWFRSHSTFSLHGVPEFH